MNSSSSNTTVPDTLLIEFFQEATKALGGAKSLERDHDNVDTNPQPSLDADPSSNSAIRSLLLRKQTNVLAKIAAKNGVTVKEMQVAIKTSSQSINPEVQTACETMNQHARLAFCRLVLEHECAIEREALSNRHLQTTGEMDDAKLFEFCGLCQAVVKLDSVKNYLKTGTVPFESMTADDTAKVFPQQRLERIQRMFLRSLGIDPDFATKTIARRFFQNNDPNQDLQNMFLLLNRNMEAVLTDVTRQITAEMTDGTTRVVSVQYSEKVVNEDGTEITTEAPQSERMSTSDNPTSSDTRSSSSKKDLLLAKQAAQLQQELLDELLELSQPEQRARLELANETAHRVLTAAMELPNPQERIQYMMSLDAETQRLMTLKKVWDNQNTTS